METEASRGYRKTKVNAKRKREEMHVNEDKKACRSNKHGVTFGFSN